MQFRLTYEGPLRPSQGEARDGQREPLAQHKHAIRRVFHTQLKKFWETNKFLKDHKIDPNGWWSKSPIPANQVGLPAFWGGGPEPEMLPLSEAIANMHRENGYRFVPLVREEFDLLCSLKILMLRRDFPLGSIIHAGDLDNRIKTLIDGLRRPRNGNELRGNENPAEGEDPFYVLLEDDDLVSGLTVETDMLFAPLANGSNDEGDVKIVISVEIKPEHVTMFNLSFA
jgi:hypothetical protein